MADPKDVARTAADVADNISRILRRVADGRMDVKSTIRANLTITTVGPDGTSERTEINMDGPEVNLSSEESDDQGIPDWAADLMRDLSGCLTPEGQDDPQMP
jgi:hypothetical protein